jgi:hypothetical protein
MNGEYDNRLRNETGIGRRNLLLGLAGIACLEAMGCSAKAKSKRIHACGAHIVRREIYPEKNTVTMSAKDFAKPGQKTFLPARVSRLIQPTIDEVNAVLDSAYRLVPQGHRLFAIDPSVQTVEKKVYLNATPNGKRGIDFEMYPGKTYGANALQRVTFHESMHILGWQTDSADKTIFSDSGLAGYHQYARQRKRDIDDANGVGFDVRSYDIDPARVPQLDQDGLFPLFDESAYDGSITGHPFDDLNELMASSLTVMHYFPNEVVDSVETLCPDDRRITAQYMGSLITAGKEVAADPRAFETFFKPQLTDYIAGAGLR